MNTGKTTYGANRFGYRVLLSAFCTLLLAIFFVGSPMSAQAATVHASMADNVTCYGDWCSGQDPNATHCADSATTLASVGVTDNNNQNTGTLELRWSSVCKTKWARLNLWTSMQIIGVIATQSGGYQQEKYTRSWWGFGATNPGYYYTYMIYSPSLPVYAHLDQVDTCNVCATPWN